MNDILLLVVLALPFLVLGALLWWLVVTIGTATRPSK
jgi:hypothetical protein